MSALVPVWRAGRFLRGLLEDLEAQTLAPDAMEILVVDTASPTEEGAIVAEFMERYRNVAYRRTEVREGSTAAFNHAIRAARGRYVTTACADDRHRADAFERLVAALEADPGVALAYADSDVTLIENQVFGEAALCGRFRWPDFDPRLLFQVCCVGPQPMLRREVFAHHGCFDEQLEFASDYEYWLRLAAAGERFLHVPEVLGLYLWSPHSNEHAQQERSLAESERARARWWPASWGPRPGPGGSFLLPVRPPAEDARRGDAAVVSVIVRTAPGGAEAALAAVDAQTHPAIEVVLVDDGHVPGAAARAAADPRRRTVYVRPPRALSRAAARNLGGRVASGTWVAYADGGGWAPAHLRTVVADAERHEAAVAWADPHVPADPAGLRLDPPVPLARVVHRRSALHAVGGFDARFGVHDEWEWLLRASSRLPLRQVSAATALDAGVAPEAAGPSGRARLYECWPVEDEGLRAARAARLQAEAGERAA